jgi:hypothetical protein
MVVKPVTAEELRIEGEKLVLKFQGKWPRRKDGSSYPLKRENPICDRERSCHREFQRMS